MKLFEDVPRDEIKAVGEELQKLASITASAAVELRNAKVEYAKAFQIAKARNPGITDGHAHQIATEETNGNLSAAESNWEIQITLLKGALQS